MTLMLMVARRAGEGERELRDGRWAGWCPTQLIGTKVSGATLGIIGFDRIGQAMAQRAHFGFGMKIIVRNRSPVAAEVLARCNAIQVTTIEDLLPQCDFVALHCPGGTASRHLINSRRLDLMRPGAFLINTARGEVVDEHAQAQALRFGTIGGAGLDVFEREPLVPDALLGANNLVLLPHLGSATRETREAMGFRVLEIHRRIYRSLVALETQRWTPRARDDILLDIEGEIDLLWMTGELRLERPSLTDEIEWGLQFFRDAIFDAVPQVFERFNAATQSRDWQAQAHREC